MIQVFIGTKAQYIKTAPLLRLMDARGIPYRLIDSGQHAKISASMRSELGVREPDSVLGGATDVSSIPHAIGWSLRLATRLFSRARLRREIFGGRSGVCVVHGDTPSTLLSTLMAKRAGLKVVHLEAGLRSHKLTHPFPEELIRVFVMRMADVLCAPDAVAVANLERMRVRGRVVPLIANTSLEALRYALGEAQPVSGPAIMTMHRVENLHNRRRVEGFVALALRVGAAGPVRVVLHEPTVATLRRTGADARLRDGGIEMTPLQSHASFVRMLAAAPFVVTDGGSIQEECALLGVPTLLWRERSERPDGLGANVVMSRYDPAVVDEFLADPQACRRPFAAPAVAPSEQILEAITGERSGTAEDGSEATA